MRPARPRLLMTMSMKIQNQGGREESGHPLRPFLKMKSCPSVGSIKSSHFGLFQNVYLDPVKSVQAKPVVTGVKRGRRPNASLKDDNPAKKIKLSFRHSRGWGQVLTVGQVL